MLQPASDSKQSHKGYSPEGYSLMQMGALASVVRLFCFGVYFCQPDSPHFLLNDLELLVSRTPLGVVWSLSSNRKKSLNNES